MAYDEILAGRIRTLLVHESDVTERNMFGGLAFMVAGNMAVVAGSSGGLMLRTDPATADAAYLVNATPTVMQGRELASWLDLDATHLSDAILTEVVAHGVRFARTLPAK